MAQKHRDYFAAGVRLVWLFDSNDRTVTVFMSQSRAEVLCNADMLTGNNVLPAFSMPVRDLFAELDRRGP
jgi:Uma2 family endonuclease